MVIKLKDFESAKELHKAMQNGAKYGIDSASIVKDSVSGDYEKAAASTLNTANDLLDLVGKATKKTNITSTTASISTTLDSMWNDINKNKKIKLSDVASLASDVSGIAAQGVPHPLAKAALGLASLGLSGLSLILPDDADINLSPIFDLYDKSKNLLDDLFDGFNFDSSNIPPFHDNKATNPNFLDPYLNPFTSLTIYDPLILDLDGDGIETTTLKDGVYFDHNGDDISFKTSWVDKDDALLVLDKNLNNQIDNGNELFGNFTEISNSN